MNEDWNYLYHLDSESAVSSSSLPRHSKKSQNIFPFFSNAFWKHHWWKMTVNTLCMNRQSCCFSLITASIVWYVTSNYETSNVFMPFCVCRSLINLFLRQMKQNCLFRKMMVLEGFYFSLLDSCIICLLRFALLSQKAIEKTWNWMTGSSYNLFRLMLKTVLQKYLVILKVFRSRLLTAVLLLVWLRNCTKFISTTYWGRQYFFSLSKPDLSERKERITKY